LKVLDEGTKQYLVRYDIPQLMLLLYKPLNLMFKVHCF